MRVFRSPWCVPASTAQQRGQALVEAVLAMSGLAVLWVVLHWLAHYQDAALSATHASRHAAFVASRNDTEAPARQVVEPFFTGPAHRWTDRRGQRVLAADTAMQLSTERLQPLSVLAQPGRGFATAGALRRDWSLEDQGILQAQVTLDSGAAAELLPEKESLLKLDMFDLPYPTLARSTRILTGAGHAASDAATQSRLAGSRLAWGAAHSASSLAAREVQLRAAGVEDGWGRPGLELDWLQPWGGLVPAHLITDYEPENRWRN